MHAAPLFEVRRLGRTRYEDAHAFQEAYALARADALVPDALFLTEHEPVVTLGRGSPPADAAESGLRVVETERGGEATWHGPGQLVGYPILFLPEGRRDLHAYLRELEEVVIRALGDFGVRGGRVEGKTGVWVGGRKVCSIGVAVRRWVTWHGFALNVHADLVGLRALQALRTRSGIDGEPGRVRGRAGGTRGGRGARGGALSLAVRVRGAALERTIAPAECAEQNREAMSTSNLRRRFTSRPPRHRSRRLRRRRWWGYLRSGLARGHDRLPARGHDRPAPGRHGSARHGCVEGLGAVRAPRLSFRVEDAEPLHALDFVAREPLHVRARRAGRGRARSRRPTIRLSCASAPSHPRTRAGPSSSSMCRARSTSSASDRARSRSSSRAQRWQQLADCTPRWPSMSPRRARSSPLTRSRGARACRAS